MKNNFRGHARTVAIATASAVACSVLLLLSGCGGGQDSEASDASNKVTLDPPPRTQAQAIPSMAILPTFHMAPVELDEPGAADELGVNASAQMPPHTMALDAVTASIPTARLTPQALHSQLQRMRAQAANAPSTPREQATAVITSTVFTPAQIRAAYGLPAVPASTTGLSAADSAALGAGQTIYLIDAFDNPNIASDLNTFSAKFGLPACTSVTVSSATKLPLAAPATSCQFSVAYPNSIGAATSTKPAYSAEWSSEIALDVQWAHAIAPLARIVLMESADDSSTNLLGAVVLANRMGPGVVSMSFGASEGSWVSSLDSTFSAAGMTYVASTGDDGAQVNWPAASSKVLAVGGTSLAWTGTGPRYEAAWSGAGGGVSAYVPRPDYQATTNIAGVTVARRAVADVSFNADPLTGQYVAITPQNGTLGWYAYGGTSIAAPQWAGLLAIANAQRVRNGMPVLADPHSLLYGIAAVPGKYAAALADITSGNDGACTTCTAAVGYDQATGWGTPNAAGLLPLLTGLSAPTLPASSLPAGIATVPYAAQWAAKDANGSALSYTLTGSPAGLIVTNTGLVSWPVPVTGSYSFTVTVANAVGQQVKGTETLVIAAPIPGVPGGAFTLQTGSAFSKLLGVTPSGASFTYSMSGAPSGLTIDASGTFVWAKPVKGSYRVTVTAKSAAGKTASGVYVLTVITPTPPVFSGTTKLSGSVGTAFKAALSATDPNGTALTYSLVAGPSGLAVGATGAMTWSQPVAGTYTVRVSVTGYGYTATNAYTLTVVQPDRAPSPSAITVLQAKVAQSFSTTVVFKDPDGDTVTYSMTGAPSGLTLSSAGKLSWAKPVKGVYALRVTARDPKGLTTTSVITLTVTA